MPKDLVFYTEIVLITVMSLIAANAWIRWLGNSLDYYAPGALRIDFSMAILSTLVAIFALHVIFRHKNSDCKKEVRKYI